MTPKRKPARWVGINEPAILAAAPRSKQNLTLSAPQSRSLRLGGRTLKVKAPHALMTFPPLFVTEVRRLVASAKAPQVETAIRHELDGWFVANGTLLLR